MLSLLSQFIIAQQAREKCICYCQNLLLKGIYSTAVHNIDSRDYFSSLTWLNTGILLASIIHM